METDVITNTPSLNSPSAEPKSNMFKYIIIFIILAVLGFNLFTYVGKFSKLLGKITDYIINIFKPILAYFGYGVTTTAKKTIDLTAKGSKKAINVAAGTLTGGINVLEKGLNNKKNNLDKALKKAKQSQPLPDESGSLTQSNKGTHKAGFCYIGEDRGFRSCISVGEGDTCMSGDIFPSKDLCINPNLRSG
jgi:hypothetical protein